MSSIPAWLIALIPLALLLIAMTAVVRYIRRGTAPLHRAVSRGKIGRVKQFLLADPNSANRVDRIGFTPLQYAALWDQVEVARLLLDSGATVEVEKGWPPLHYACSEGHLKTAELLLDRGTDPNSRFSGDDSTALHSATIKGRLNVVRFLLERGADPNLTTKSGWTPSHFAASAGHAKVMRALLEYGADWQAVNVAGESPLQLALSNGHPEVVSTVEDFIDGQAARED